MRLINGTLYMRQVVPQRVFLSLRNAWIAVRLEL